MRSRSEQFKILRERAQPSQDAVEIFCKRNNIKCLKSGKEYGGNQYDPDFVVENFLGMPRVGLEIKTGVIGQECNEYLYQVNLSKEIPVFIGWVTGLELKVYNIQKLGNDIRKKDGNFETGSGKPWYCFVDVLKGKVKPIKIIYLNE
jgi:hypothetical protein